ncbi:MAG: DNA repair protein RecO [Mycoplasmataceae bacterium]|nr:DNA repair protein RecO [Mycoplasmataceae bacterium]
MAEITSGIVINKLMHKADDEIITILTSEEILVVYAMGVRKIKSKNRYALDYGNLINVEFFRSRLNNKMSKLKRATMIKQPPVMTSDTSLVILTIMKYLSRIKIHSTKVFKAYIDSMQYFGEEYNHQVKTYILFNILDSIGAFPQTQQCVDCGRPDRIEGFDYSLGGFLCSWHVQKPRSIEELRAIKALATSIEEYKETDPSINKYLFEELVDYMSKYI